MANEIIPRDLVKLTQSLNKQEKTATNAYFKVFPIFNQLYKWCCDFIIPDLEKEQFIKVNDEINFINAKFSKKIEALHKIAEINNSPLAISAKNYYEHIIKALNVKSLSEYDKLTEMLNRINEISFLSDKGIREILARKMKKAMRLAQLYQFTLYEIVLIDMNYGNLIKNKNSRSIEKAILERKSILLKSEECHLKITKLNSEFFKLTNLNGGMKIAKDTALLDSYLSKLIAIEKEIKDQNIYFTIKICYLLYITMSEICKFRNEYKSGVKYLENTIQFYNDHPQIKKYDLPNFYSSLSNYLNTYLEGGMAKSIADLDEKVNYVNHSIKGFEERIAKNYNERLKFTIHYAYYSLHKSDNNLKLAFKAAKVCEGLTLLRKEQPTLDLILTFELANINFLLKNFDKNAAKNFQNYLEHIFELSPKTFYPDIETYARLLEIFYLIESDNLDVVDNKIEAYKKYLSNHKIDDAFIHFLFRFVKKLFKTIGKDRIVLFQKSLIDFKNNKDNFGQTLEFFEFENWISNQLIA